MKTFSRSSWDEAQASWSGFSPEWRDLRHTMALQGCIFAPAGTEFDSWEDDSPSQRAILIRAIRETPSLLRRCSRGATSWHQLLDRLLSERDDWRAEQRRAEPDPEDRPRRSGAAQSIASILERIAASAGLVR